MTEENDSFDNIIPAWLKDLIDNTPAFLNKKELSRLANFVLIDIRLIFIVVSVYITIATAITTSANNEAANDSNGNRTFNLTSRPEHTNVPISDVSNSVLWNCRERSVTNEYYKVLYGSLFVAFVLVLLVFMVTRMSVLFGNMTKELSHLNETLWNMQLLKHMRKKLKEKEIDIKRELHLNRFIDEWLNEDDHHHHHDDRKFSSKRSTSICHSMLIIPFLEAVLLVIALPFMLSTYDINPIGCLVGPDENAIEYNNITGRVQLRFTEGVLAYQTAALTISIILMVLIIFLAIMLPAQYYRITKRMAQDIATFYKKQKSDNRA